MITSIYAAIAGLIFIFLTFRTIANRIRAQVAIGDGGDKQLHRAIRAHANFAEFVPMALILVYFLEVQTGLLVWTHILGGMLVLGRLLHAYGVSQLKENLKFRQAGMILTLATIVSASIRILIFQFS